MAKTKSRIIGVSEKYYRLRKRVKEKYQLPTLTSADAFIAVMFEEREREKNANQRISIDVPNPKIRENELRRFLGGLG